MIHCERCSFKSSNPEDFKEHMKRVLCNQCYKEVTTEKEEKSTKVIATYTCPNCNILVTGPINFDEDYYKITEDMKAGELHICSCVSGGIYAVFFECPYCHKQIPLLP
jgi:hypothetical protein